MVNVEKSGNPINYDRVTQPKALAAAAGRNIALLSPHFGGYAVRAIDEDVLADFPSDPAQADRLVSDVNRLMEELRKRYEGMSDQARRDIIYPEYSENPEAERKVGTLRSKGKIFELPEYYLKVFIGEGLSNYDPVVIRIAALISFASSDRKGMIVNFHDIRAKALAAIRLYVLSNTEGAWRDIDLPTQTRNSSGSVSNWLKSIPADDLRNRDTLAEILGKLSAHFTSQRPDSVDVQAGSLLDYIQKIRGILGMPPLEGLELVRHDEYAGQAVVALSYKGAKQDVFVVEDRSVMPSPVGEDWSGPTPKPEIRQRVIKSFLTEPSVADMIYRVATEARAEGASVGLQMLNQDMSSLRQLDRAILNLETSDLQNETVRNLIVRRIMQFIQPGDEKDALSSMLTRTLRLITFVAIYETNAKFRAVMDTGTYEVSRTELTGNPLGAELGEIYFWTIYTDMVDPALGEMFTFRSERRFVYPDGYVFVSLVESLKSGCEDILKNLIDRAVEAAPRVKSELAKAQEAKSTTDIAGREASIAEIAGIKSSSVKIMPGDVDTLKKVFANLLAPTEQRFVIVTEDGSEYLAELAYGKPEDFSYDVANGHVKCVVHNKFERDLRGFPFVFTWRARAAENLTKRYSHSIVKKDPVSGLEYAVLSGPKFGDRREAFLVDKVSHFFVPAALAVVGGDVTARAEGASEAGAPGTETEAAAQRAKALREATGPMSPNRAKSKFRVLTYFDEGNPVRVMLPALGAAYRTTRKDIRDLEKDIDRLARRSSTGQVTIYNNGTDYRVEPSEAGVQGAAVGDVDAIMAEISWQANSGIITSVRVPIKAAPRATDTPGLYNEFQVGPNADLAEVRNAVETFATREHVGPGIELTHRTEGQILRVGIGILTIARADGDPRGQWWVNEENLHYLWLRLNANRPEFDNHIKALKDFSRTGESTYGTLIRAVAYLVQFEQPVTTQNLDELFSLADRLAGAINALVFVTNDKYDKEGRIDWINIGPPLREVCNAYSRHRARFVERIRERASAITAYITPLSAVVEEEVAPVSLEAAAGDLAVRPAGSIPYSLETYLFPAGRRVFEQLYNVLCDGEPIGIKATSIEAGWKAGVISWDESKGTLTMVEPQAVSAARKLIERGSSAKSVTVFNREYGAKLQNDLPVRDVFDLIAEGRVIFDNTIVTPPSRFGEFAFKPGDVTAGAVGAADIQRELTDILQAMPESAKVNNPRVWVLRDGQIIYRETKPGATLTTMDISAEKVANIVQALRIAAAHQITFSAGLLEDRYLSEFIAEIILKDRPLHERITFGSVSANISEIGSGRDKTRSIAVETAIWGALSEINRILPESLIERKDSAVWVLSDGTVMYRQKGSGESAKPVDSITPDQVRPITDGMRVVGADQIFLSGAEMLSLHFTDLETLLSDLTSRGIKVGETIRSGKLTASMYDSAGTKRIVVEAVARAEGAGVMAPELRDEIERVSRVATIISNNVDPEMLQAAEALWVAVGGKTVDKVNVQDVIQALGNVKNAASKILTQTAVGVYETLGIGVKVQDFVDLITDIDAALKALQAPAAAQPAGAAAAELSIENYNVVLQLDGSLKVTDTDTGQTRTVTVQELQEKSAQRAIVVVDDNEESRSTLVGILGRMQVFEKVIGATTMEAGGVIANLKVNYTSVFVLNNSRGITPAFEVEPMAVINLDGTSALDNEAVEFRVNARLAIFV
jgi:hypothetical protein